MNYVGKGKFRGSRQPNQKRQMIPQLKTGRMSARLSLNGWVQALIIFIECVIEVVEIHLDLDLILS